MRYLLILIGLIFAKVAGAAETQHRLGFEFGFDSSNSRSGTLSYGFTNENLNVYTSMGSARSEPLAEEASSKNFMIGVGSSSEAFFTYGGEFSSWGLQDELISRNLRFPLGLNWTDWNLIFVPAGGNLKFQNVGLLNREFTVETSSFEFAVDYLGLENWRFGLTAVGYEYSKDLTVLSNARVAQFFTETTLSLTGGIIKNRSALDFTYLLPIADVTVRVGSSTSAIDESVTGFLELDGNWDIDDHLAINLMFGSAKVNDYGLAPASNQDDDSFGYGAMGFSYKFD